MGRGVPRVVTVLPDVTGLDKAFDYVVPAELDERIQLGGRVRVPLHGRRVGGWVIGEGGTGELAEERLVPISAWSSVGPAPEILQLASWASIRWGVGRLRPFLVAASPPANVRALPTPAPRRAPRVVPLLGVERMLAAGGGVIRTPPGDDPLATVSTAAAAGPTLVVHPSIDTARRLAGALRREGWRVALLPEDWSAAAAGAADVVIGARSAAWGPCPALAAVVVLDEHDEGLQEERTPTWHARDVLVERGERAGAAILLVSPCPTVAALHWSGRRWARPTPADETAGWPIVHIVDRSDDEPWKRTLVTSELIGVLRDPARRVVCVHNAPGRARLLSCRTCRSLLRCERCEAAVRQVEDRTLHCERCGAERPPVCQACGSTALANVKPGVARLREEIEAAAGRRAVAVTGESDGPWLDDVGVFVGTEAVLHRVRDADVVAFVDMDAELLAPRYRAAEQAMALLVRAARVVGPRAHGGRILVQTHLPAHPVLQAALLADPGRLARSEAATRRDLGLPPFAALAEVSGTGAEEVVRATGLPAASSGSRWLVRGTDWMELGSALAAAPRPKGSRVRVEVDPRR